MRTGWQATCSIGKRLAATAFVLVVAVVVGSVRAEAQLVADLIDRSVTFSLDESASKAGRPVYAATVYDGPVEGVVVQGFATGERLSVEVRASDTASPGAWQTMHVVRSVTDPAFLAGLRFETPLAPGPIHLRFEQEAGSVLHLLAAGVFGRSLALRSDGGDATGETSSPVELGEWLIFPPSLRPRAEWGAAPFRGDSGPLGAVPYRNITFHHAAGFGAETLEEGLEQVKRIQEFHQDVRGWSDIGYHFVMDEQGRLYQGRPFLNTSTPFAEGPRLVLGAHAGGANTSNVGVCVLGCYHPPEGIYCRDELSASSLDSLVASFAFLSERYGVDPEAIKGHRDFGSTACPGNTNYALLPDIRTRVAALRRTGNQPLGRVALQADADDAGVVTLTWEVVDDNGIAGFEIDRVDPDSTVALFGRLSEDARLAVDSGVRFPGPVAYRLYVVDAEGRRFLSASVEVDAIEPVSFTLTEVFPNPFSEQARVRYYLRSAGFVRMALHDATGRKIRVLADEYAEGGRWYEARIEGGGLASGAYFVTIAVEGFADTVFKATEPLLLLR